jgi:hypothetical protein
MTKMKIIVNWPVRKRKTFENNYSQGRSRMGMPLRYFTLQYDTKRTESQYNSNKYVIHQYRIITLAHLISCFSLESQFFLTTLLCSIVIQEKIIVLMEANL